MDSQSLAFPRVDTAASASWVAENAAAPESTITLGSASLRARKVISMIRSSMELATDAPNFAAMVEDQLVKATALAFDYAGLCGSGVGENPMGIEKTPGIGTADVNGAITVDLLLDAYYALLAANVPEDAITCVMNTGVAKNLSKLKYTEVGGATNAYLAGITWPEALKKVKFLVSNQIPSVSSKATVLMGDFSQLYMGVRLGGQLNVSNSAVVGGESTFERSQLGISYLQRGDFIVASPSSFYSLTRVNA
jgi:HK97 family phage major capsid protein